MLSIPDIGHVYPKTGLDADIRFDTTPRFVSTGSLFLDGTNDYVNINGLTMTTSSASYSFSFWFKSVDGSSDHRFFDVRNSSSGHRCQLYCDATKIYLNHYDGTSSTHLQMDVTFVADFEDGTWHHLAMIVSSGTGAVGYVDGQLLRDSQTAVNVDLSSADGAAIGAAFNGDARIAANLCHFGFWHAALTQAQVRALMTATTYAEAVSKGGSTPRAYYLLEADADDSVDTQDGTLTNGAVIVGARARLPSGFDLTGNRLDAQLFSGRAVDFDGTGGSVNDELVADAYADSSTAFSVSCWIKATNYSANRGVATNGTHAEDVEHFLIYSQAGVFRYHYTDGTASYQVSADYTPTAGEWFHYAATVDGSTASAYDAKVYINGKLQTTAKSTTGATWYASDGLSVGSQYGYAGYWDGSIADVRMFNVELTAAQVLELYQVPEQVLPTGVASSALKRWYPLNDYDISGAESLAGLYLQDCSGNGKHLLSSGCAMEFSQPNIPQLGLRSSSSRIYFGGAGSGDYCESSDTDLVTNTFSFSIWVNAFSNAGNYSSIISGVDTGNDYDEGITIDLGVASSSSVDHISVEGQGLTKADQYSGSIPFGQWFHLAFTSDASDYKTYVNGSEVNSASRTNTTANKLDIIRLGARYYSSAVQSNSQFDGLLTDCGVFNAVLDADSVAAIHAAGIGADIRSDISNYDQSSALVHFWKTDNPVTCTDLEGSDNLTVNGAPAMATVPEGSTEGLSVMGSLTQNRLGGAVMPMSIVADEDAGSSPGILAYAKGPITTFDNTDFTVTMWVYLSNTPSNMRYFHWVVSTGYILMKLTSDGEHSCLIEGNSGGTPNEDCTPSLDVRNAWSFVAFRKDAADDLKAFAGLVTDASLTSEAKTTNVGDFVGSSEWYLGSDNAAYRGLSGSIAMPRIWTDTALSDGQINALFESGKRILRGD